MKNRQLARLFLVASLVLITNNVCAATLLCPAKESKGRQSNYTLELDTVNKQIRFSAEYQSNPIVKKITSIKDSVIVFDEDPTDFGSLNRITGRFERYMSFKNYRTGLIENGYDIGTCRPARPLF